MSKRNLTTSILGDAGSAEATVAPNLESLNTGSDSYVTSISDTSELNVFGNLKIYDNYWDTLFARHIINAANAGAAPDLLSQVNIQGNTEGWCRADHMVLMVPITFTYNWEYVRRRGNEYISGTTATSGANDVDDALKATTPVAFPWETQAFINNPAVVFSKYSLTTFKHAWLGCLDVFERLRLLVGNNGQMLQKQIETEPIGMKYHMSHGRYGPVLEKTVGEWGIMNPVGLEMTDATEAIINSAGSTSGTNTDWGADSNATMYINPRNAQGTRILAENNNGCVNMDTDDSFYRMISSANSCSNYDSRLVALGTVAAKRWCVVTRKRNLTLPLQAIIPFFRGAKFLPPDFRFKFEIEVNTGRTIMRKDPAVLTNITGVTGANWYYGMEPLNTYAYCKVAPNASGIEFQYPYHILRQPVQAAISSMWLQKPFLYNYETIQTTEVIPTLGATFINFTISISTQRPTVIDAFLFPISTMADWESEYTVVKPYSTTAGTTIPTGYRIKNTPHNHGDYSTTGISKNSSQAGPCVWSDLEIMFSGRTAYRFLNNYTTTNAQGNDSIQPHEFFVQLFEEQSFRSTGTEYNAKSFVERGASNNHILVNNQLSSRLLRLIVQPGGWADRGVISSRQGATTITLNINFRRPLSNQDRFVVLRTNPEQLVFDSDKNVTIIQWPAIKSNMGYLIPNITAAP